MLAGTVGFRLEEHGADPDFGGAFVLEDFLHCADCQAGVDDVFGYDDPAALY